MKKRLVIALAAGLLAALAIAGTASAQSYPLVKGQLSMYPKVNLGQVQGVPWPIVSTGAKGSFLFDIQTAKASYAYDTDYPSFRMSYTFVGSRLDKRADYTLVNYAGWPNVVILGEGTTTRMGTLYIKGWTTEPLVCETNPADLVTPGAKIWLVPSEMLVDNAFVTWAPELVDEILFEGIGLPLFPVAFVL